VFTIAVHVFPEEERVLLLQRDSNFSRVEGIEDGASSVL